jgi:uncharacterized protein
VTPSRTAVLAVIETHVANEQLRRHMLACEAIMRSFARRFAEDEDVWGLAGLAHDLDSEETAEDFSRHGAEAAAALERLGAPAAVVHAVAAHNPATGVVGDSRLDVALIVADQLSGLITAAALIRPDRRLDGVALKSVRKRYREGAFARGVDRASIARCTELGIELDETLAIGLAAMQGVAPDLGL